MTRSERRRIQRLKYRLVGLYASDGLISGYRVTHKGIDKFRILDAETIKMCLELTSRGRIRVNDAWPLTPPEVKALAQSVELSLRRQQIATRRSMASTVTPIDAPSADQVTA